MPVRELSRAMRGEHGARRWSIVIRQSTIAVGILAALWATGWLIGRLLLSAPKFSASLAGHATNGTNVLRISALALSLGTLSLVLLGTQVARMVLHRRGGIPRQMLTPMRPAVYETEQRDTGTDGRRRYDSGQFTRR